MRKKVGRACFGKYKFEMQYNVSYQNMLLVPSTKHLIKYTFFVTFSFSKSETFFDFLI